MKMPDDQIKVQSFHGNFILVHNQMSVSHVSVNYYLVEWPNRTAYFFWSLQNDATHKIFDVHSYLVPALNLRTPIFRTRFVSIWN